MWGRRTFHFFRSSLVHRDGDIARVPGSLPTTHYPTERPKCTLYEHQCACHCASDGLDTVDRLDPMLLLLSRHRGTKSGSQNNGAVTETNRLVQIRCRSYRRRTCRGGSQCGRGEVGRSHSAYYSFTRQSRRLLLQSQLWRYRKRNCHTRNRCPGRLGRPYNRQSWRAVHDPEP